MSAATMNEMERLRRERDFWHRVADMEKTQRVSLELGAKIPEVVAERDALSAHLHQIRHAFNRYDLADYCSDEEIEAESELYDLMEKSPETSLARLIAEKQADILEQMLGVNDAGIERMMLELRRQAEEGE